MLLHCDEWDRVVALPRHKFVTGATLLQLTSGIPQGSVLGPILFVIYINDLLDKLESDCYMFADDTKIFRQIASTSDNDILQSDVKKLEDWSATWLIRFHPDKCKVVTAGKAERQTYDYILSNTTLEHGEKEKYIGVTIDSKLTFEHHMNEKINKANSIMGLIRRTFTCLDEETFLLLNKALIRPHLEYANALWSPYKIKDITAIENVQRRATKLVLSLKNLEYEDRLRKLKLPTLKYRRLPGDMIETHIN